jgi:nuclear pore complex protein Nup85
MTQGAGLNSCVLRGIPKSAVYFLKKLSTTHPSRVLRRLVTELIPILTKHPRSKDYTTEHEFLASYRRWKEQLLKHFRRHVDELEDYDGDGQGERREEGEWRSAIEIICSIMEGDKQTLFTLCKDQEWGWREALGVWGVWIDIRFTREALPCVRIHIYPSLCPTDVSYLHPLFPSGPHFR